MSYRLPDTLPEVREPSALLFDVARPSYITVDAGTITRINIPCAYSLRMSRHDLMLWDHMGWPSPGRGDHSNYAPFLQIRPIDLKDEGYTTVSVELLSDYATYVSVTGTIDHDHVVLTIDADTGGGVEVPFVVFLTGHNDEVGDLRDLVTKGRIRILKNLE